MKPWFWACRTNATSTGSRRGVLIDGRRTRPARVRLIRTRPSKDGPQGVLQLVLREGRNRQVRRMCESIGHPVASLRRTRFGALTVAGLRPGQIRELTPSEIRQLTAQQLEARVFKPGPRRRV